MKVTTDNESDNESDKKVTLAKQSVMLAKTI
jgi:hypothetical protein